jgi:hypothetical protein
VNPGERMLPEEVASESLTPHLLEPESALRPVGRGYAVCRVPQPRPDVTEGPGSRLVLRNSAPALTAAAHGNETAALSLFEQPFCSGVQGAKVTLLRVRALRRIAKSSGPTVGGQRIDRTGDLVAAKYKEERAGADTSGLSARRVVLGTLQEVTVRHHGRVQTIVSGPAATRRSELFPNAGRVPVSAQDKVRVPRRLASYEWYRHLSA